MKDFGLNKKIVVEVKGTQTVGDMSDTMEIITPGTYNYKNGISYILYEEYNDETKSPLKNMIKIGDKGVELVKRGEYNVNMVFSTTNESVSYYNTPFGQILIGIITEDISIAEEAEKIVIRINYRLTMNGEYASDNEISITVKNQVVA